MKIVICGKGGSGKSTLTTLLAMEYADQGRRVLVLDTDESNTGLHRLLGVPAPEELMDHLGGKQAVMGKIRSAMSDRASVNFIEESWSLDSLPENCLASGNGIRLAAIGKIHNPGEGCACPMGFVTKQTLSNLELKPGDVVLIDTDAGVEHFGRGIEEECDAILMIVDPSYESLQLSEHIERMANTLNIPLSYVLNRTDEVIGDQIRTKLAHPDRIIGELSQNADILMAGLEGRRLSTKYPAITAIVEKLIAQENQSQSISS